MSEVVTIGNATLYLGDCLEILPTLDKVDAVITDPPYGISLVPPRQKTESIKNDGRDEARELWDAFIPLAYDLSKDNTSHIFWTGWSETWTKDSVNKAFKVKSCIVWGKNVFGIGYYTRPQHEMAWYAFKGKPPTPEKAESDLWLMPKVQAPIHSCEKPKELLKRAIKLCLQERSGTVLDPFCGVGSTGVAAIDMGCRFVGIEIERKYFDIACERIENAQKQGRLFE